MHINFNPEKVNWEELLEGGGGGSGQPLHFQYGGGSYTIFQGTPYQRGAGIGALFKSLVRFLVPIGKNVGAAIGRQGLESGSKVLSSILEGKKPKDALIEEGQSGLEKLFQKAASSMAVQQKGEGKRKRGKIRAKKNKKPINRSKNKRIRIRKLFSKIGPPLFPNNRKRNNKKPKTIQNPLSKKLRFDALGPY